MASLRSRLKDVDGDQQTVLRTAMIAIAHADGIIKTEEVAGIEKVYQILGLDPRLSTLICMLAPGAGQSCGTGGAGRSHPREPSISRSRLDASRIAAIRSDGRVSSVLGQIFQSEPDGEPEPSRSFTHCRP
jgi:hypothetical protein